MTKLLLSIGYERRIFNLQRRNARLGFSMVEYLATLVIAAILLFMTLSNFRSVVDRSRVSTAMGEFRTAILLARAEAIRHRWRVDVIPVNAKDWGKVGWC